MKRVRQWQVSLWRWPYQYARRLRQTPSTHKHALTYEVAYGSLLQERRRVLHAQIVETLESFAGDRLDDHVDQAETHYQQALSLADRLGMRPLQAHCYRGLGTVYSQAGQRERARAQLSTALNLYRDMEMTFWLPETEAALADMEGKA